MAQEQVGAGVRTDPAGGLMFPFIVATKLVPLAAARLRARRSRRGGARRGGRAAGRTHVARPPHVPASRVFAPCSRIAAGPPITKPRNRTIPAAFGRLDACMQIFPTVFSFFDAYRSHAGGACGRSCSEKALSVPVSDETDHYLFDLQQIEALYRISGRPQKPIPVKICNYRPKFLHTTYNRQILTCFGPNSGRNWSAGRD